MPQPDRAPDRRRHAGRATSGRRCATESSLIHGGWDWVARHGAIGPGDRLAARFGVFGSGSCLAFPPGALFGERWIHIGATPWSAPT